MNASAYRSTRQWRRDILKNVRWSYHSSPSNRGNILILHGYRESHDSLDEWIRCFCELGFNVITCDLPGHGQSAAAKPGYFASMEELTDVAHALILELIEWEQVPTFVIGFSLGAFTELVLLLQQRYVREELIKGVVSISAPLDVRGTVRVYCPGLSYVLWTIQYTAGDRPVPRCFVGKQQLEAIWEPSVGSWCYRGPTFFKVAYLFYRYTRHLKKNIKCLDRMPILAFQGTEDTTAGFRTSKRVFDSLSNTAFHSVPGMRHYLLRDLILSHRIMTQSGEWLSDLAARH